MSRKHLPLGIGLESVTNLLSGNILITGGSGFLGRAILRRAQIENWPAKFTIYSRDETKQWELKHKYPTATCVLGDVARDIDRLMAVMAGHETVIHAAAVKYIPEAEHNVFETIDVNIVGSRNVALAARSVGVKTVIGISTDKACAPANVYGMTKAVMERMFSEANRMGSTRFITCRYGNVVGSTGSVIPVFRKHIEEYGEVRVTDSKMTRFWLSVDEAIDIIVSAHDLASIYPGYTFIPSCPAMKIVDIAEAVWSMKYPEIPPNITFTGIRPGEKMHESLFNEQEAPRIGKWKLGFALAPAIEKTHQPEIWDYTSQHPNHWMTQEEMIKAIKDAELV